MDGNRLPRFLHIPSLPHIQTHSLILKEYRSFPYLVVTHLNSLAFVSDLLKTLYCSDKAWDVAIPKCTEIKNCNAGLLYFLTIFSWLYYALPEFRFLQSSNGNTAQRGPPSRLRAVWTPGTKPLDTPFLSKAFSPTRTVWSNCPEFTSFTVDCISYLQ